MDAVEIQVGYTYAAKGGSHFRKVLQILEQDGVTRVRYWDSEGKNSCIPLEKFVDWASHQVAAPQKCPAIPNKHRKPISWPGD